MTLVVNDRVQEVSTSTGSGPFVLGGGVTGYQTFSVGIGNTNSTYYTITNGTNWMDILGTYTSAANSITVDKILTSSAGGTTAVSFAAGTKNIFCTYPAATAVLAAPAAYPTVQPTLNLDFANSKTVDPRITFVRNNTATYYDGQTTAMAEQNLLLQSQAIGGSPWANNTCTSTLNSTVAPDGTTTASLVTISAQYGGPSLVVTLAASTTYTMSVYVLSNVGSNTYNLQVGGNISPAFTPTATWTRQVFTFTNATAGATNAYGIIDRNASGFGSVYLWGAQLEQRSAVTAYTPTTTAAITNYIPVLMTAPAGVPRLDYNPTTGQALGLLIEESRVNLLNFSSSFAASGGLQNNWLDTSITRTAAAFVAPDSTQVGIQFTASAANATVISTAAVGSSLARTFSVWLKRISGTGVINYTLDNGATWIAQTITSTVTRYTFAATTANQQVGFQIVTSGDSIGIWGAQLEAGAFATSYMPSVATTMTRADDAASMVSTNFSSWYNQSQGTMNVEADAYANGFRPMVTVRKGVSQNYILALFKSDQQPAVYINAVLSANLTPGTQIANVFGKLAWSQNGTVFTSCLNARTPVTATSTAAIPTMEALYIGASGAAGVVFLNGHIRKISYYPVALSSSSLVALTS